MYPTLPKLTKQVMDREPLHLHCCRWERPKKNSLCLTVWSSRIRSGMRRASAVVDAAMLQFVNSLASDAFSFFYCLLLFSFLLYFGCHLFFGTQIRRICIPIQSTKVGVRYSCFFINVEIFSILGLWVTDIVS